MLRPARSPSAPSSLLACVSSLERRNVDRRANVLPGARRVTARDGRRRRSPGRARPGPWTRQEREGGRGGGGEGTKGQGRPARSGPAWKGGQQCLPGTLVGGDAEARDEERARLTGIPLVDVQLHERGADLEMGRVDRQAAGEPPYGRAGVTDDERGGGSIVQHGRIGGEEGDRAAVARV